MMKEKISAKADERTDSAARFYDHLHFVDTKSEEQFEKPPRQDSEPNIATDYDQPAANFADRRKAGF